MATQVLTLQQHKALSCVRRLLVARGFPPTLREIAGAMGLAHINAVRGHLLALERKGYIQKAPDQARSIRIVDTPSRMGRLRRRVREALRRDQGVAHQVVYGLAWATRQRAPLLVDPVRGVLLDALDREAAKHSWTIVSKRVTADHVAVVVKVRPKDSPRSVARQLRQQGLLRRHGLEAGHLWARGYLVTTAVELFDETVREWLQNGTAKRG
jgi:REP element-mobilizing transposase RayT